jgi:hypothetical protein
MTAHSHDLLDKESISEYSVNAAKNIHNIVACYAKKRKREFYDFCPPVFHLLVFRT